MEDPRPQPIRRLGSRVGDVLAGKYRLEELLGAGGMGDVYRAVNELVGREVAIKVLRPEHAQNEDVVERFMREARAANLVRHENVVDVLDVGQDEAGSPFIVQELLRGEDLNSYARRLGGKVPLEEVVDLLCPVIEAVAEAHAQGVVHRDIKPENVFLVNKGSGRVPKLLDFGISKLRSKDVRRTEAGVMLGTPAYMAPEQLQASRDADPRTDVWAIGVMLFELLSGRLPFDAEDAPSLFVAIATKDAPELVEVAPEIPPTVSRLVARCLRRRPADRYPSAAELARDLRHVLDGTEIEPTQKRSIPPRLAALVPDLLVPKPPSVPKIPGRDLDGRALDPRAPTAISRARAAEGTPERVEVPSLAPREPAEAPPPPPPPKPQRPREAAAAVAPPAAMPGLLIAPGANTSTRASNARPWTQGAPPSSTRAKDSQPDDMSSWVIGVVIVGLTAIFAFGALMHLAHRPEGWPIVSFVTRPNAALNGAVQGGLALVAGAVALTRLRRGVKHWRGELAGGLVGALVGGASGAAALFVAVELATAAW